MPMLLIPPDAAAGSAPGRRHVCEDDLGHGQVAGFAREVPGLDPEKRPPAFVVVELIDKVSKSTVDRFLRLDEGVVEDCGCGGEDVVCGAGAEVGFVVIVGGGVQDQCCVGENGQRVGGHPPAALVVEACGPVVECLEGGEGCGYLGEVGGLGGGG